MPNYLTKTFTETRYWQRGQADPLYSWAEIPRNTTGEIPLDAQVREWVERTGATIVQTGQLGMFGQFMDEGRLLRCTLIGQTVLYLEAESYVQQEPTPPASGEYYGPERGRAEPAGVNLPPPQPPAADAPAPFR